MNNQNNVILDISVLYRNINKFFDKHLTSYDLGPSQMISLLMINENEGISMQSLTNLAELDKGSTTKSIQKLVESGYIEIVSDENDKRIKHLYTTNKSNTIMNDLYQIRNSCANQLLSNISYDELNVLSKIANNSRIFEEQSYQELRLGGIQKLTLLDYPGKLACTIFATGCNFKCPFCHNKDLVYIPENFEYLDPDEILDYLSRRKGLIEAVCISGGEPLLQPQIFDYIKKIKDLGYLVKIDTNGHNPDAIADLIDHKLVDYIAMDIKNTWRKYSLTTGISLTEQQISNYQASVQLLLHSSIDYEFRTTVVKDFHSKEDLIETARQIEGCKAYYLQKFKNSGNLINPNCTGYDDEEMNEILKEVQKIIPHTELRG